MFTKELSIRGRQAKVISKNHRSIIIKCDGFTASLRELELLALKKQGKSAKEMAMALGIKSRYVSNALWHVRSLNSVDPSDNVHHWGVTRKADELELLTPWALAGLSAILSEWNSVRDRNHQAEQSRKAIRVELPHHMSVEV